MFFFTDLSTDFRGKKNKINQYADNLIRGVCHRNHTLRHYIDYPKFRQ